MFTPSFTPRVENCSTIIEELRGEQRIFTPTGQLQPEGTKFTPGGQLHPGRMKVCSYVGARLKPGLWSLSFKNLTMSSTFMYLGSLMELFTYVHHSTKRFLAYQTRDRCYDFLNIFAEKFCETFAFFAQTPASFCKNCDHNIGFWEKRQFFRRKLGKIAENCDHNIDPRSRSYIWSPNLQLQR
jgi:hypothetical protein